MTQIVDRQTLLAMLQEPTTQLIDVLPAREYNESHLPGALSLPLKELDRSSVANLHHQRPIVAYCHDGL